MRTITAPSTPLDGISDQELWEFAQVVAIVDESLAARVSFLTVVERHPFLRGRARNQD
ncbi:MAG: hypothetical protein KME13_16180 [Myxacorys californica WJT36-NPBG1]|nr:hypothetical protein [Myxacorys californica WJT36-NPBG1]